MKLLKCFGESGDFYNTFNTNIRIEPQSKVGVVSLAVKMGDKHIIIDDDNHTIEVKYKVGDATFTNITLRNARYNTASFVQELTRAFNTSNVFVPATETAYMRGFEWKNIMTDDKVVLQFNRGKFDQPPPTFDTNVLKNLTQDQPNGDFTKTGSASAWNSFGISSDLFNNGGGVLSVDTSGTENFAFGLVESKPEMSAITFTPAEFSYCITQNGGNYQVLSKNSDITAVNVASATVTSLKLVLAGGHLRFFAGGTEIASISDWEYDSYYFYGLSLYGATNQEMKSMRYTPSPFSSSTALGTTMSEAVEGTHNVYIVGAGITTSKVSVKFTSASAELLGFIKHDLVSPQRKGYSFPANYPLVENNSPSCISVELPTLSVESFSSTSQQQIPVVAYIPALTANAYELTYQNDNPIMIDLSNTESFNLTNLRVRLLPNGSNTAWDIEEANLVLVIGK